MTPEELDKATADEAWRLLEEGQDVAVIAARLAREQEQERAKVLLEYAEGDANRGDGAGMRATQALAAYKAGKAAQ
jgi:hypothetical protein